MDENQPLCFRDARESDLDGIVRLLADDSLGRIREAYQTPLPKKYLEAFHAIEADSNNELIIATLEDELVGVLQITYTPQLTYQGGWRATIEGVRTASAKRGQGIGRKLIQLAISRAKARGCHLVQLTTNIKREQALQFYNQLEFKATHQGMKLHL